MHKDLHIIEILKKKGFSMIEIDQILNYLETLDYQLDKTRYIGSCFSKNERMAKYFFLRDKLNINLNSLDDTSHINEILDQCIDWSEFWRLLVIKKGFCCIRLEGEFNKNRRYAFLYGPNILLGPSAEFSNSIHDDFDC